MGVKRSLHATQFCALPRNVICAQDLWSRHSILSFSLHPNHSQIYFNNLNHNFRINWYTLAFSIVQEQRIFPGKIKSTKNRQQQRCKNSKNPIERTTVAGRCEHRLFIELIEHNPFTEYSKNALVLKLCRIPRRHTSKDNNDITPLQR